MIAVNSVSAPTMRPSVPRSGLASTEASSRPTSSIDASTEPSNGQSAPVRQSSR